MLISPDQMTWELFHKLTSSTRFAANTTDHIDPQTGRTIYMANGRVVMSAVVDNQQKTIRSVSIDPDLWRQTFDRAAKAAYRHRFSFHLVANNKPIPSIALFSQKLHEDAPGKTRYFENPNGGPAIPCNIFVTEKLRLEDRISLKLYTDCVRVGLVSPKGNLIVRMNEQSGEYIASPYNAQTQLYLEAMRDISIANPPPVRDRQMLVPCQTCKPVTRLRLAAG